MRTPKHAEIEHIEGTGTLVSYGTRPSRFYRRQAALRNDCMPKCKNLPTLKPFQSMARVDDTTAKYRLCVCLAPACCGVVYEPILEMRTSESDDWDWVKVSRRRLFWWRMRGLL